MSWFSSLFNWLSKLLKKVWKALGPILVIAAILFVAFAPLLMTVLGTGTLFAASLPAWLSWLPGLISAAGSMGWAVAIPAGLGLAYLIDPAATTSVLNNAVDGVTSVATNVAEGVGSVIGTTIDSVFTGSNLLLFGGLALGAYLLLSSSNNSERESESHRPAPRKGWQNPVLREE